jgi:hypothetical protein
MLVVAGLSTTNGAILLVFQILLKNICIDIRYICQIIIAQNCTLNTKKNFGPERSMCERHGRSHFISVENLYRLKTIVFEKKIFHLIYEDKRKYGI